MIDYELLNAIDPNCGYDEWIKVGMALKHEGADWTVWDRWSQGGSTYKPGECEKKWKSFRRSEITGGTLYHIALQYGYEPKADTEVYDMHNLLLDEVIVDPSFVRSERIPGLPDKYEKKAKSEMLEYFTTLFDENESVGYCINFVWDTNEKKWKPTQTIFKRTAGDIIEKLRNNSVEYALGTLNSSAGAGVRFNPLDGKGENNNNVTRWKYCLIESDEDSVEKQYALYQEMNLPITFLIHSGGKSLHAIIRVDAESAPQYKQRVREMYDFVKKNGLHPDEQDKNESRFSRLPGVKRGDKWQYIVARNIGAASYSDWIQWREEQADDLPASTNLSEIWNSLPPLKDELIPGILRVGHKMLVSGPSKSGKSFFLINLAISIAEGAEWIGFKCRQGKVCYVNLELDDASCFHRFKDIYERRGLEPRNLENLTIWNLRGHAASMDRLAPILIHRFKAKQYQAVIIDPIYKVITGDENNATEMGKFCSYFDRVATEVGVSMIYCHHHSKGASGKYANAADRSSGSGVFARDPDAILDLRELNANGLTDKYRSEHPDACDAITAWEISGTLREFAPMEPMRVWFDYPMHVSDDKNFLGIATYGDTTENGKGTGKNQKQKTDWYQTVEDLLSLAGSDTAVSLEAVGISEGNAKRKFVPETDYEVATIDGTKVVHRRNGNEIVYLGKRYERIQRGKRTFWGELQLQNP